MIRDEPRLEKKSPPRSIARENANFNLNRRWSLDLGRVHNGAAAPSIGPGWLTNAVVFKLSGTGGRGAIGVHLSSICG